MSYPHPIIAREGWPFIALSVAVAAATHWYAGAGWAAFPWVIVAFMVQFFRDPPRAIPQEPKAVLSPELAGTLARYMREVVTSGTGRKAGAAALPMAGKTGTAELANAASHAWFVGFAPYGAAQQRLVFEAGDARADQGWHCASVRIVMARESR